jgi:hypothetical protein
MSLGEGEQDTLVEFLELDGVEDGTFLSANYDSAAWYDFQDRHLPSMPDDPADNPWVALSDLMVDAAQAASDRAHLEMRFTADGLVIESRATYK